MCSVLGQRNGLLTASGGMMIIIALKTTYLREGGDYYYRDIWGQGSKSIRTIPEHRNSFIKTHFFAF